MSCCRRANPVDAVRAWPAPMTLTRGGAGRERVLTASGCAGWPWVRRVQGYR